MGMFLYIRIQVHVQTKKGGYCLLGLDKVNVPQEKNPFLPDSFGRKPGFIISELKTRFYSTK